MIKNSGLFCEKILILFLARIIIAAIKMLKVINIEDIWSVNDIEDVDKVDMFWIDQDREYSVIIIRITIVLHHDFFRLDNSSVVDRGNISVSIYLGI